MSNHKELPWDDLATLYDKRVGGRRARTLPMEVIFEWATKQPDIEETATDGLRLRPEESKP